MKKNKLDSVVFMWISFGLAILATLTMFLPIYKIEGTKYNIITGFFGNGFEQGAWPAFIGFMLILVGAILTGFIAMPNVQPSYTGEKLFLCLASFLEAVGTAAVMCSVIWWCLLNGKADLIGHAGYSLLAGSYICLGLSAVAICSNIYALVLDR